MKLLLICTLVLCFSAARVRCALAPYSETRSFRDALEGRSLEDAISGPVDKDTSSYGDRSFSASPSPMMLNVPANGNFNNKMSQQMNNEQYKSTSDGDAGLERESAAGEQVSQMEMQQQMMEQNYGRQMQTKRQPMNGRSAGPMMDNLRQQQAAKYESGSTKTTGNTDASFGEDQTKSEDAENSPQEASAKYGGQSMSTKQQRNMMQQTMMMKRKNENSMRYGSAAQMRPTGMTPSMAMPNSNQPTYSNMQQHSMQMGRRMEMQKMMNGGGGYEPMGVTMSPMDATTTNMPDDMTPATRNPMEIRKMSPAMMNAMLNKMMNMRQKNASPEMKQQQPPAAAAVMAMLPVDMLAEMMMPQSAEAMAPAKREQYKRMMMATMMQQKLAGGMSSATMMPAQPETNNYADGQEQDQQQRQMDDNKYGQQQMSGDNKPTVASQMPARSPAGATGYNMATNAGSISTMSPVAAMMLNMMAQSAAAKYQSNVNSGMMTGNQMDMSNNIYARNQGMMASQRGKYDVPMMQREMIGSSVGTKGRSSGSMGAPPVMSGMRVPAMNRYGNDGMGFGQDKMQMTAYKSPGEMSRQKQAMAMMMMAMAKKMNATNAYSSMAGPMKGSRQVYKQQREQDDNTNQDDEPSQTSYQSSSEMDGPAAKSSKQTYLPDDEQQQDMEQKQDSGYGAAPIGMAEPFAFDYKIADNYGNGQYRKETSNEDGVVRGTYGYMDAGGIYRHVEYVADENGFRAKIKSNEPGLSGTNGKSSNGMPSAGPQSPMSPAATMATNSGNNGEPSQTPLNDDAENADNCLVV